VSFNQAASTALQSTQSPHINKLQTPSSTPPPQPLQNSASQNQLTSTSSSQLSSAGGSMGPPSNPHAHRKLFPTIDANNHVNYLSLTSHSFTN